MPRIQIDEWPRESSAGQAKVQGCVEVAKLMANAALTAPITGGTNGNEVELAYGQEELELIAREMERLAHQEVPKKLKKPFLYEAVMARESDVIVFIGNHRAHSTPIDAACGLCGGEPDCSFFYDRTNHFHGVVDTTNRDRQGRQIKGPICMIRVHDLGYALGSALWVAASNFLDAKPFYSMGLAGRNLGFCMKSEVVVGIAISATAKNPYVDIPPNYHLTCMTNQIDATRKISILTRQLAAVPYQHFDPSRQAESKNKKEEE